jgi:hypothetical protein
VRSHLFDKYVESLSDIFKSLRSQVASCEDCTRVLRKRFQCDNLNQVLKKRSYVFVFERLLFYHSFRKIEAQVLDMSVHHVQLHLSEQLIVLDFLAFFIVSDLIDSASDLVQRSYSH